MEPKEVFDLLQRQFAGKGIEPFLQEEIGGDPFLKVPGECLVEICEFVKHDPRLDFKMLHCLSAVDHGEVFASVIHLYSLQHRHKLVIRTDCPRENPVVPSLAEVWKAANWHERESYDMMGIVYEGHPDLKRILLSDDWEGFPLRKDYQMPDDSLFPWEDDEPAEVSSTPPASPTAPGASSGPLQRPESKESGNE
jgi:NADH-quinone oxidoreductase subunit C